MDQPWIETRMFYVSRDAQGQISSLHREPCEGAQMLPADHPDVLSFLGQSPDAATQFADMDANLVRVLEDLIDALIRRNVLCITDLPLEAQLKLFDRKHFREGLQSHSLQLFDERQARVNTASASGLGDWANKAE